MSGKQNNINNSVGKLKEASSLFPSSSLSSPGTPPPPPPPPLPNPRIREIPASLCFQPALPNHALFKICSNLQPPPLRRWRHDARTGVKNQHVKKNRKPQLEPKPATQTAPEPTPPPTLPQPPTLIPKPGVPTPPRLTPKPVGDDRFPSKGKKTLTTEATSTCTSNDKRMKINDGKAEDDYSDDNVVMKEVEHQLALSGDSNTKTGHQDGENEDLSPDRRLLRARHGGGNVKPQGDCSQPSINTHRPVTISSSVPMTAVRPSFLPLTKSCTATTASSPSVSFAVPTGEPSFLSTNGQDSFKTIASSFGQEGKQMDQCVPTGVTVIQKEKSSTVASDPIASILMPPPPSTTPIGQRTLTKAGKKSIFRSCLLTVQDQIRAACAILRRAEQIRNMTDPERRLLVENVLNAMWGPDGTGHRLPIGPGTSLLWRSLARREPGQQIRKQDTTTPEKSDRQTE